MRSAFGIKLKIMKLELKHLAPYLPYNLRLTKEDWGKIGQLVPFVKQDFKGLQIEIDYALSTKAKPILRPISDLSKLGVDNIPINEHTINLMIEEKFNEEYGVFEHYKGSLELVKEGEPSQRYDSRKVISFEVFEEIRNELLKGHYDLFGLIEKSLAIDVNSLSLADA